MGEVALPVINDLSRPFWEAAADGRLQLPWCTATGRPFWPPAPTSPFAAGGAVEWREIAPEGVLLSRVTYRRAFQKAFAGRLPYAVGLVEIAPDVRLQAHLSDPDGPETPQAGDRVLLGFEVLVADMIPVPVIRAAARG